MAKKTNNWRKSDQGSTVEGNWRCSYFFKDNRIDFMISKDGNRFELHLFSKPFSQSSLSYEKFVEKVETAFPGEINDSPSFGYTITTSDLWEIFEWAEKMKDVLGSLYEEYALE